MQLAVSSTHSQMSDFSATPNKAACWGLGGVAPSSEEDDPQTCYKPVFIDSEPVPSAEGLFVAGLDYPIAVYPAVCGATRGDSGRPSRHVPICEDEPSPKPRPPRKAASSEETTPAKSMNRDLGSVALPDWQLPFGSDNETGSFSFSASALTTEDVPTKPKVSRLRAVLQQQQSAPAPQESLQVTPPLSSTVSPEREVTPLLNVKSVATPLQEWTEPRSTGPNSTPSPVKASGTPPSMLSSVKTPVHVSTTLFEDDGNDHEPSARPHPGTHATKSTAAAARSPPSSPAVSKPPRNSKRREKRGAPDLEWLTPEVAPPAVEDASETAAPETVPTESEDGKGAITLALVRNPGCLWVPIPTSFPHDLRKLAMNRGILVFPHDRGTDAAPLEAVAQARPSRSGYRITRWIVPTKLDWAPTAPLPRERPSLLQVRLATEADNDVFEKRRAQNTRCTSIVREVINKLPASDPVKAMEVESSWVRFDGEKITIRFSAPQRLKIGAVAKDLFCIFRCRIWMHQVNY